MTAHSREPRETSINLRLDAATRDRLDAIAKRRGVTRSRVVRELLDYGLKKLDVELRQTPTK